MHDPDSEAGHRRSIPDTVVYTRPWFQSPYRYYPTGMGLNGYFPNGYQTDFELNGTLVHAGQAGPPVQQHRSRPMPTCAPAASVALFAAHTGRRDRPSSHENFHCVAAPSDFAIPVLRIAHAPPLQCPSSLRFFRFKRRPKRSPVASDMPSCSWKTLSAFQ